jgi:hypothetical protein
MPHARVPLILNKSHAYFPPSNNEPQGSIEAPGLLRGHESLDYFFTFNNTCPRRFC